MFSQSIAWRMIWSHGGMKNAIVGENSSLTGKDRYFSRKTIISEHHSEFFNCFAGCNWLHYMGINPFWVCVTMSKNMWSMKVDMKGLAKSRWTLPQGWVGHSHGWSRGTAGAGLDSWQMGHVLTITPWSLHPYLATIHMKGPELSSCSHQGGYHVSPSELAVFPEVERSS